MIALITGFLTLLPEILKIVNLFVKTPKEKQDDLRQKIREAIEKAEKEHDVVALSKLINGG